MPTDQQASGSGLQVGGPHFGHYYHLTFMDPAFRNAWEGSNHRIKYSTSNSVA